MIVPNFPTDFCPLCSRKLIHESAVFCPLKDKNINLTYNSHYCFYPNYQELYIYLDDMIYHFTEKKLRCVKNRTGGGLTIIINDVQNIDFKIHEPAAFLKQLETLKNFS